MTQRFSFENTATDSIHLSRVSSEQLRLFEQIEGKTRDYTTISQKLFLDSENRSGESCSCVNSSSPQHSARFDVRGKLSIWERRLN